MVPPQNENQAASVGVLAEAPREASADAAADARAIVSAIRWLRENREHLIEAQTNLPAVLDRLGLTETARQAVTAAFAVVLSAGVFATPGSNMFWSL